MKKITFMLLALAGLQANAQFSQNFESGTTLPAGWSIINQGSETGWTVSGTISGGAHSGSNAAEITYDDIAHNDYLITPQIAVSATASNRFSFWIKSRSGTFLEPYQVLLSTTNTSPASFSVVLQASQEAAAEWQKKTFDLSNYVGQSVYIAIRATGTNEFQLYVDDVVSDAIPTCASPTLPIATPAQTTAALSWTESSGAASYDVEYGLPGFALGSGTSLNPALNSQDISGLQPGTDYVYYVRATCAGGAKSDWVGPTAFTTTCAAIANFTQNFETTPIETVMPNCWGKIINSTSTASYVYVSQSDVYAGTKTLRLGNSAGATATLYAVTPELSTLGSQSHRIRFFAKGSSDVTFQVGTVSDLTSAASFTAVQTITLTTTHQEFVVNFDMPVTNDHIAFKAVYATSYAYVSIDNVVYEPIPSCPDVSALVASNPTTTGATIAWNAGSATAWQFAVGATTVTDPGTLTAQTATSNPFTITGLEAATTYRVWVRNVCGENFGSWSQFATFTTACNSFAVPTAIQDFEGTAGTALPVCWSTSSVSGTVNWATTAPGALGDITSTVSGTRIAYKTYTTSSSLLVSQPLDFSAVTSATFINMFLHRHALAAAGDKYNVFVNSTPSLTGAVSLLELFSKTTVAPTVSATGFYNYQLNIPESFYGNPSVYVIIQGTTTAGFSSYTLGVDDFSIQSGTALGNQEFNAEAIAAYPNPVASILNLNYSQNLKSAAVYNLMGQQVFFANINANSAQLDLSHLSRGAYIVKVVSGDSQKTIKIIKE